MAKLARARKSVNLLILIGCITFFATCAFAGPTGYRSHSCVSYCKEANKFQYEVGNTYVYDYSTVIRTLILEETSEEAGVELSTKVEIEPVTSCEFKLKLRNVVLKDSNSENQNADRYVPNNDYLTKELEKYSTHFAFQDGKIEHLCSSPDEPVWVTNVKRGILSMFHNTMEDLSSESELQETDVNGKCRTLYTPSGASWGGSDKLIKYKDLSTCTQRQNHITTIQSIPYSSNPASNSLNLLSGNVECSQIIRNHKIERVQCNEEQKFKPFDDKNSGAKNLITQTFVFEASYRTSSTQKSEYEMKRKTLVFEVDGMTDPSKNEIDNILELLEKLEKSNFPNVKAEAPALFIELVEVLRQTSEEGLRSILKLTTKKTTTKFLLDAIPLVNTAASLAIMRDFFLEGQLSSDEANSWLWSVTFIKYPTLSMISALSPLLEEKPGSTMLFSFSSLISSYCTNVSPDCKNERLIQESLQRIASPLEYSCQGSLEAHEIRKAVVALKSLGNAGIYPRSTVSGDVPILQQCMILKSNPLEVRLAAVDAHRRMACSSFSNLQFLQLYADTKENTEVRIKAYLISMNCADLKTIDTVKNVLQTEVVNQVGSFVWTHLTNLQETNRPDKQAIRSLVSNEFLKIKFQTDARKFSRNYESSIFRDDLNMGAGIDGNLIFTEESFLPKSGMINLTVQMFGGSVNLLEFGGRVQAPESLLEPIFGPNGYFPDESMTDFLKNSRNKREVGDNEIERLPSVYELASKRLEKIPGGSFYTRIFGHEVMYKDFEVRTESSIPDVVDENGKNWFNIKTILDNLSTGKKAEFTKSSILMDVSYSVPTSAGIPLSLGFKAAATVGLSAEGKFNVGKFIEKRELDIYGYIRPNTAINVDASLTVRLGARNMYIRSGLAVRNVLRSSTSVETQLVVNGYKVVKATVNLPQDRQDIFEASAKVLMLRAAGDEVVLRPLPGTPQILNEACTGNQFSQFMGLKVCREISLPGHFTFTPMSPALVILYVEKTDKFDGYLIDYNFESSPSATKMDIVFDTPGSNINRRTAVNFKKDSAIGRFLTTVETPSKVFKAEGIYSQFQKGFDLTVMDEGERVLQLNSSIHRIGNRIEPSINLIFFKRPLIELKGVIEIPSQNDEQKRATVDLVLKHLTQNPVRINGNFISSGEVHEASLGIESFYLTGNVRSQLKKRPGHWSTKSVLEYSWKHGEINTVDINAKLQRTQKSALSKLSTSASFIMSKFPDHSVELSWDIQSSHGFCENSAKFTIGKSTWDGHTLFSRQSTREQNEIRMQMSLANPRNDVDYHLEFSHKINEQLISTTFIGRSSVENEVQFNFDYDSAIRPFLRKTLTAETTWPGSEYSFRATIQEKRKGEFEGELLINLNNAKEMKGTLSYINNSNNLKLDHILEFRARGFSSVPISGSIAFSATDKQSHIGCNVQFEGKKPYSSRLSTSVDYSHSRNSHKIEAKVTFNEKKYNGEITYSYIKSGTRHLTVDLHLDNHIFMDAKMSGMFPDPMVASIFLIPSKNKHPEDKLELKGTLETQNLGLYLNYFGEKVSFTGGYGDGFVTGETIWRTDQRVLIHVRAPTLSLSETSASIFVLTPLEGFRNVSVHWEHFSSPEKFESKFGGNFEEQSALIQFNALVNPIEVIGKAVVDISGVSRLEGELQIQKNDAEKVTDFRFLVQKEGQVGISVDYINLPNQSSVRLDFRGCKLLPEVLFDWKFTDSLSGLKLEWRLIESVRNVLELQLETRSAPASYELSIKTPWETLKEIRGSLTPAFHILNYKIEIETKGDFNLIPSKISIGIENQSSSRVSLYASAIWRSDEIAIGLEGVATNFYNKKFTGILKFPQRSYKLDILSQMVGNIYTAEVKTDLEGKISTVGLTLDKSSSSKHFTAAVWGIFPSEKKKEVTIGYESSGSLKKISFDAKHDQTSILNVEGSLNSTGYSFWSLRTSLDSSVKNIPSFNLESDHNMIDIDQIHHKVKLNVVPSEGSFWARVLPARDLLMQIEIQNQDSISGLVKSGGRNIRILGEIHQSIEGREFQLIFSPSGYNDIEIHSRYQLADKEVSVTGMLKSNSEKVFEAEIGATKSSGIYSATVFIKSRITPTIDGRILLDPERWIGEVFLKNDDKYIIKLNVNGQVLLSEGNLNMTVKSSVIPLIEDITIELKYRMTFSGLNGALIYISDPYRYQFSMNGIWKEDEKSLQLSSEGEFVGNAEISIENWTKLVAHASQNERKIGEIHLEYENQMTDFVWGKHVVHMKYIDNSEKTTKFSVSLELDPKRFDATITTPFQSWTQIKAYGHLDLQSNTHMIVKLGLHKEQDQMESSLEMKTFRKTGKSSIATEISVIGFSRLRKLIFDTVYLNKLQASLSPDQPEKFAAVVTWSAMNVNVRLETPLKQWKHVSFTGDWELSRSPRHINLKSEIDDATYEFRASANLGKGKGNTVAILETDKQYKISGSYDFTKTGEASIQIQATTPFQGYEELFGKASCKIQTKNQVGTLEWKINTKAMKIQAEILREESSVMFKLHTPFKPWDDVTITLTYDPSLSHLQLTANRGDGKIIAVTFTADAQGNFTEMSSPASSNLQVKIETPIVGFEETLLSLIYDRTTSEQKIIVMYSKNRETVEGQLDLLYRNTKPLTLDIHARMASGSNTEYKARAALSIGFVGKNTFSAHVEANNTKHEVEAIVDISSTTSAAKLQTTLPFLKRIHFSLDVSEGIVFSGIWEGNNKRATIDSTLISKGFSHGSFNLSLSSPFPGMRNVELNFRLNAISENVDAAINFQNEDYRWMAKVDGNYDQYKGNWKAQINTPVENYQDLVTSFKYTWTSGEKGVACSVERSVLKLFELDTSLRDTGFQITALSEIFEYPISLHSSVKLGPSPISIQLTLSGGDEDYKTNLELSIQGISGMIHLKTSVLPYINSRLAWNGEGTLKEGNAWASITNTVIGTKALRTLWRMDDWSQMKLEIWARSNQGSEEKGGTIQYSLSSDKNGNKRFSGQFTLTPKKGTHSVLASVLMKQSQSKYEAEIEIETPLKALENFEAKGFITLNPDILTKFECNYNNEHRVSLEGSLELSVVQSALKINLNAPIICKPFQIQAKCNFVSEKKTMDFFFNQDSYHVSMQTELLIPETSQEIQINMNVSSNVPFAPMAIEGILKGSYQVKPNDISQLTISMESAQAGNLRFAGAIRPTADFHLKLKLDTSAPILISSTSLEVNWRGSLRQGISSDLSFTLGELEFKARQSLSTNQFHFDFNSDLERFKTMSIEATWQLDSQNKLVEVKASVDGQKYLVTSNCDFDSEKSVGNASVVLSLPNEDKRIGSLVLLSEESGKLELTGSWRENEVSLLGFIRGTEDGKKWIESGVADFSLTVDNNEQITIHSNHKFKDNEYFLNMTAGPSKHIKLHFTKGSHSTIASTVQWNTDRRVKLVFEIKPDRFDVSFSSPWVDDITIHGLVQTKSEEATAEGYVIYDRIKSSLTLKMISDNDRSNFEVTLDVPNLHQKIETTISVQKGDANRLGGKIDMILNGQHMSLKGQLGTRLAASTFGNQRERKLFMELTLPSDILPPISTQITLTRPAAHFGSMKMESRVNIGEETSVLAINYDIPIFGSNLLGLSASWKSPLNGANNYELTVTSEGNSLLNFKSRIIYQRTEVNLDWKMTLPDISAAVRLATTTPHFGLKEYELRTVIFFDISKLLNVTVNAVCKEKTFHFKSFIKRDSDGISSLVSISSPQLLVVPHNYRLKLRVEEKQKLFVEISGSQGQDLIDLVGEGYFKDDILTANTKVTGSFGSHYAKIDINRANKTYEADLILESTSLLLGKTVGLKGRFNPIKNGFETSLRCRTIKSTHTATLSAIFKLDEGFVTFKTESPRLNPVIFHTEWKKDGLKLSGAVQTDFMDMVNKMEAFLNMESLEGRVTISSPLIPSSHFNFHLKAIVTKENVDVLGDVNIRNFHWRLEGTLLYKNLREMTTKLEILSPYDSFKRLTLALKSSANEVYAEIHTPFKLVPNAMLKVAGISEIQERNWKNMQPSLTIGLPIGTVSTFLVLKAPNASNPGLFHLYFEEGISARPNKYEFRSEVSPLGYFTLNMENTGRIHVRIVTPLRALSLIEGKFEGKIVGRKLVSMNAEGKHNEDTFSFIFDYQNENGHPKVRSQLTSPFQDYEEFSFLMSVDSFQKIGIGKSLHIEFDRSKWEEKVQLDTDYRYRYNGLLDLEGEVNMVLGSFMDIPKFHADLKSGMKGSKYTGVGVGTFGSQTISLELETEMTENDFSASFRIPSAQVGQNYILAMINLNREGNSFRVRKEIVFEDQEIVYALFDFQPASHALGGEMKLSTPWGKFELQLTVIPVLALEESTISFQQLLENTNATFGARLDDWRLFGLQLVSRDGRRVLEVYNPIRPVSMMFYLERSFSNKLKAISEICWDLENPIVSTIGVSILLEKGFNGYDFELKVQAEKAGQLETKMSHSLNSSKLNQLVSLKWNSPLFHMKGESGYHIMVLKESTLHYDNAEFRLLLDLPWRSSAIEMHSNKSSKESQHTININWDVKRDPTKYISLKLHGEKKIAWRTSEFSNFFEIDHPLSDQPIILTLDQIYKDNRFQHIELDIKTSSEPQSNFVLLISRNNTDWNNFRAIASHIPTNLHSEIQLKTVDQQSSSIEFSYMDRVGVVRDFTIEASLIAENLQLEIYSGSNEQKSVALKLRSSNKQEQNRFSLQIFSMQAEMSLQKILPYLEIEVKHDGERRLRVSGGLPHKTKLNLHISGTEFGKTINYLEATVKLNNSNTLSGRVTWIPDLWQVMMKLDVPEALRSTISSDIKLKDLIHKITEEIGGRWISLSPTARFTIKETLNFIKAEAIVVHQEWARAINYFKGLYEANTFYFRDVLETLNFPFEKVCQISNSITNGIQIIWKSVGEIFTKGSTKLHEMYIKYEGRLEFIVMEIWDETENFVNGFWRDNLALVSSIFNKLKSSVGTILDALEGRIYEVEQKFMAAGLIRKTIKLYKEYAAWIEEIPIQEYVQNVENMLSIKIWDHIVEYLKPIIDAIENSVEDKYFKDLLETPPLPYIRFVARTMNAGLIKFWEVIEVEQRIKNLVRASLKQVDGWVQRYIPASSFVYNLEEGSIMYDQSLSAIQWDDLTKLPRWKTSEEDSEDINQLTNFYYQVLDKIESLKPLMDMNIRTILPPFGSYALMAGDYHYFTFDKKYFRFAGECSYLLVADLSHTEDAFSLIVNYDNRAGTAQKKSYTIMSDGKLIDIDISTFKVTLNGKKVELPLSIGSTFIRRHQTWLEVYDTRGFQMSCSLSPSVCTLWVSGWHFGKLAGLLGTYDNEQINDFRSPEGQVIPDVSTFAYSWRVGKNSGQCRMKNYARDEMEPMDVDNICHNLLNNRGSPLRPCFNTVDTEIFMEMCKYDVFRNVNSANRAEAACPSMSAYVAECQKNNVDVWIPPTCVRCRLEDGTALTTGENATLEVNGDRPPPKSSDNVILIQQGSCVSAESVADAIGRLDLALNNEGIFDNRYAIVGFGGKGLHGRAHIKTSSSRVWSHSSLFKISTENETIGSDESVDVYEAIQYASTLGFRAGVSKNILAVTCGEEQCGESKRYADILTLLLENDIKFHLIVPKPFLQKGARKEDETNQVFGIDINGAYTVKNAKQRTLIADKSLLRQINIPKDFCTPLAMESNGTRFNFETPTKKLLDVWSHRVATTSHPSECQRCECVPDRYGSASLMCHQCVSPSLRLFMEQWKSFQTPDGEDLIPFDLLEHNDFIIT